MSQLFVTDTKCTVFLDFIQIPKPNPIGKLNLTNQDCKNSRIDFRRHSLCVSKVLGPEGALGMPLADVLSQLFQTLQLPKVQCVQLPYPRKVPELQLLMPL